MSSQSSNQQLMSSQVVNDGNVALTHLDLVTSQPPPSLDNTDQPGSALSPLKEEILAHSGEDKDKEEEQRMDRVEEYLYR